DNYISDENDLTTDVINFSITLSSEEWDSISLQSKLYCGKNRSRYYEVLTPFNWSNVIQDHFFYTPNFLVQLNTKEQAYGHQEIYMLHLIIFIVLMDCTYTGFFNTNHYKKRKLAGSEKERSLDAMLNRHIAPSVYRRNEAN
ncbi:THAP-type domain-containing protein, partial [Aphis craccivora]